MYKVFVNDKPLFVVPEGESVPPKSELQRINFEANPNWNLIRERHDTGKGTVLTGGDELWESFRAYFKEIDAAGGLVMNSSGEFLFIFRNGIWDLPKGKLEKDEAAEIGAVREVEEECGITNPIIESHLVETFHTYFHKERWILKNTSWYLMRYGGSEQLIPQLDEGITEVVWLSPDNWGVVLENTYGSILDVLEQYQKLNG